MRREEGSDRLGVHENGRGRRDGTGMKGGGEREEGERWWEVGGMWKE